jgi:hypothetical protein
VSLPDQRPTDLVGQPYQSPRQIGITADGQPIYALPQQYPPQPTACQHAPVQRQSGGAAKWIGIGVGGSVLMISLALSAMAVAIAAVSVTACLIVLRSMWRDYQKGK